MRRFELAWVVLGATRNGPMIQGKSKERELVRSNPKVEQDRPGGRIQEL